MLSHIHIRNFTIIDELELDLSKGLSVITGETGAGKSILVDAIGLAMGDRANPDFVRHGQAKSEISLTLDAPSDAVTKWLVERDLANDAHDTDCIIRRIITNEGRSKAYINNIPVTLVILKELAEQVVDIHGQHAHQSLLNPQSQQDMLDSFADLNDRVADLSSHYARWQKGKKQLDELLGSNNETQQRIDLLSYYAQEFEALSLTTNEAEEIEDKFNKINNLESLSKVTFDACSALFEADDRNAYNLVTHTQQQLQSMVNYEPKLQETIDLLAQTAILTEEAYSILRDISDTLDNDEESKAQIETRYNLINDLARKHSVTPEELYQRSLSITEELDTLTNPLKNIDKLKADLVKAESSFDALATKISKARQKHAKTLSKRLTALIQNLGMEGGKVAVEITQSEDHKRSSTGIDKTTFMVSLNPGQPLKPLTQVASGGELSRISLAIQLVAAETIALPTMIFDEVDSGIGGAVAELVGNHLRELGQSSQVLCVTHLAQVAAQGHQHFKIEKFKTDLSTRTTLKKLDNSDRIKELARMLGGQNLSKEALAHAEEMLKIAS